MVVGAEGLAWVQGSSGLHEQELQTGQGPYRYPQDWGELEAVVWFGLVWAKPGGVWFGLPGQAWFGLVRLRWFSSVELGLVWFGLGIAWVVCLYMTWAYGQGLSMSVSMHVYGVSM